MSGRLKFADLDNPFATQPSLFPPTVGKSPYPPILRDKEGFLSILENIPDGVGLDYEGKDLGQPGAKNPSIIGIANREKCAALPGDPELSRLVLEAAQKKGVKIVGHSVIASDKPALEQELQTRTPVDLWDDSMIRFYAANQDLTKTPGKDEDDDDTGAMGFLGLWTMASLYTDLPNWKSCRGRMCDGPCPVCWPFEYCAVDSWAGLEGSLNLKKDMANKGIPERLYEELLQLSEIGELMQKRGVAIDHTYVAQLERDFDAKKLEIFPYELVNGKPVYPIFNPKSPKQVIDFFNSNTSYFKSNKINIQLKSTDKADIRKSLEKAAKATGHTIEQLEGADDLPQEVSLLYKLYQFKDAGKGLSSWFSDKYVSKSDKMIHPRWITCGTSTGRMASSKPNFTNIPARGFGASVRKAIVPREKGLVLLKADASQMELRKCLHAAGVERKLSKDAFTDLVVASGGRFEKAAELYHGNARDIAKSTSHAGNYGEGLQILYATDLTSSRIKKEIEIGARLLFKDWEYAGGYVSFTGGNLAERLFGDKTYESRRKALEIQEIYFSAFPEIRPWQKKISQQIQDTKVIRSGTGRYLPLSGSPEDNLKISLAFIGQGEGADFMQEKIRRYYQELGVLWLMFVHDEAVFEVPAEWQKAKLRDFTALLIEESNNLPGFSCPFKFKIGPSWGEAQGIELW